MMPIHQSIEGQPPHMGPGLSPPAATAGENGERQQKPKTLPCKYCSKRFSDLLVRHEKLVHLNEGNSGPKEYRPRKSSGAGGHQASSSESHAETEVLNIQRTPVQAHQQPQHQQHQQHQPHHNHQQLQPQHYHQDTIVAAAPSSLPQDARMQQARAAACNLDMLSDAALASERGLSKPASQFPSRFPSVQPDGISGMDGQARGGDEPMRAPSLRISAVDHNVIKNRLDEFSSVLPADFIFPSRHTLTRFLEGYISGFHEYLPFLHLPSLAPAEIAPELLLAILAVGAQYRFESHRGHALWYAAKAVALEQIRRRHSHEVHALLPTPAAYSPHSTRPSPSTGFRHTFASAQQERPMTQDTHREPFSPNTPQARLETIQAVLLLFAVGLWGASAILHEALSLQSHLAILVREEGLTAESSPGAAPDWETWVRLEGASRTKLIAYCFFNLCSIAYNMPPLLLTSDLSLFLPYPSRLWRAESTWQWQEARQSCPSVDITVHDAFARLFGRSPQSLPAHITSLGHYVLIHALTQHVFLLKQTSFALSSPFEPQRGLKPDDVEEVLQALRVWQTSFEHRHQLRAAESAHMGPNDTFPGGPVAFNATALLRLAYIRLYTDITPSRSLETRDHMLIASSLSNTPLLVRSLRLQKAVFQAIHALSMLVKAGVNYVARTKSLEWSIQHSCKPTLYAESIMSLTSLVVGNFECAVLLSKWLLTLSSIGPNDQPVSTDEKNFLEMIRRMLDETEFAVPIDPSLGGPAANPPSNMEALAGDSTRLRQLAAAVIRLWAETFKGTHIFDLVRVMGSSLDGYASLVEKPHDRAPMGRIAAEAGLG
ncbi:regulatory protein [Verticillium dahliae VdLs.17]|uniref:Regulatory protein n=1 Tax=Verticillium dahliae (strain VdLs.17 / ATCC MYA-4575 / FGSC 10137) TaxID=498257 RepID=G2WSK8_VERDV|nr:regulatory protein [Verticillium dahliae VdLs.17]EGY17922.1 regulatory protein [Verticillium dahliae VdLs.17]